MTVKRYNYLPHPIREYGPFRSMPDDSALLTLARKDQACWNLWYLSDGSADTWHKIIVHPANAKMSEGSKQIAAALAMRYRIMEHQFDGVTIRNQVTSLPPDQFLAWFESHGGYGALPEFSGSPLAERAVALLQEGLSLRKGTLNATAHLIDE